MLVQHQSLWGGCVWASRHLCRLLACCAALAKVLTSLDFSAPLCKNRATNFQVRGLLGGQRTCEHLPGGGGGPPSSAEQHIKKGIHMEWFCFSP